MQEQIEAVQFTNEEKRLIQAATGGLWPCNTFPFLKGIEERLRKLQTNSLQDAKGDLVIDACLMIVMGQARGQLARISVSDDWNSVYDRAKAAGVAE